MTQTDLSDLLTESRIQQVGAVSSWQAALELASLPLLKEGAIAPLYVEKMAANVLTNGPYMVLADYFALMHAKAGEGVTDLSMALLITEEAVDMAGVPVKLFLVLAAVDQQSHIKALSDITTILMDEAHFATFLAGDIPGILGLIQETKGKEVE